MNQSPAPIAPATRTLKTLSVAARLCLWLVFLAWGLFVMTWAALNWWIVPRIGEWRPELERWASSAVGAPVRVGDIRADNTSKGPHWLPVFMPSFELRDVQLFDPQGRVALHLPLVRTAVSVRSLWHGNFEQVVIDQPWPQAFAYYAVTHSDGESNAAVPAFMAWLRAALMMTQDAGTLPKQDAG